MLVRSAIFLLAALVCLVVAQSYDDEETQTAMKRSLDNFWRSIHMQLPVSSDGVKRSEFSRARANAYYRLG
ncbi:unnamed protein product [Caenorhabditis auriculariae]|uniref:Uncharacterized protein n=1 Tax=Caenorhabditis auriculariae TaxID=2777116 RepID=A0A8S1HV73_9PELO|nr:unnamed protein product [Caenorhabditis auriculariae]